MPSIGVYCDCCQAVKALNSLQHGALKAQMLQNLPKDRPRHPIVSRLLVQEADIQALASLQLLVYHMLQGKYLMICKISLCTI